MKSFTRMMRVAGVAGALLAFTAGSAHAAPVLPGWPIVVDRDTPAPAGVTGKGALIALDPNPGVNNGKQYVVAPDGYAVAHNENYFVNPSSAVQSEDQVYDVADESGAIIEVDLVTGKQRILESGPPLVAPTAIVRDPVTNDLYILDRQAGIAGRGAIFRLHENVDQTLTLSMVHDGSTGTVQQMVHPDGLDIEPNGNLIVSDSDASPNAYSNGTIFRIDPSGANPADGSLTPRTVLAFDNPGTSNAPGQLMRDPRGVVAVQGPTPTLYVADSSGNISDSPSLVIGIDPVTGAQRLISRGFFLAGPHNFGFSGGLWGISPVDATFGTPGSTSTEDDLYALDPDAVTDFAGHGGEVFRIDPTNTVGHPLDPSNNQVVFSSNAQANNGTSPRFVEPRTLVTARDLPDPPTISVNTSLPGDTAVGASQIIEPLDGAPADQAGCGAPSASPACDIKFQVRLSGPWKRTVTVHYSVAPLTAGAGTDYTVPPPGTLVFPKGGTLVQTISVPVLADTLDEPDKETLKLTLDSPENGILDTPARSSAEGTIIDNDLPPTLTATDPADFPEANGPVTCVLQLSAMSEKPISVAWATADGSAVQPADYAAAAATATFPAGTTVRQITANVKDDALFEDTEQFSMNLSNPTNVTLGSNKCTATILDSDPPPRLTIRDAKSNEGNSGQRTVSLTVAMSGPSGKSTSVKWATEDDAATTADKDYQAASGTLTIPAGAAAGTISLKINGDTKKEQDEPFRVRLSSPVNASILAGSASVTIVNDDDDPAPSTPSSGTQGSTTGGTTKTCSSRRSFVIRVKKTKLHKAKVVSAKVYVNGKLVTTRKTKKRLAAPVVLKGLKKGTYRTVIKAKLSDGRTVTDVRVYHTCVSKSKSKKK